ncbi:hypothetical protein J6590_005633 [Homalodisca vitripennis]|nr:hypothetical protein J6590_005633 [Homalodisca vitripennis]
MTSTVAIVVRGPPFRVSSIVIITAESKLPHFLAQFQAEQCVEWRMDRYFPPICIMSVSLNKTLALDFLFGGLLLRYRTCRLRDERSSCDTIQFVSSSCFSWTGTSVLVCNEAGLTLYITPTRDCRSKAFTNIVVTCELAL